MDEIAGYVSEREWEKFHTPRNLAESIAIESAELLELFQWELESQAGPSVDSVKSEIADVLIYCLEMANVLGFDVSDAVREKIIEIKEKYPADEFRGRWRRHR